MSEVINTMNKFIHSFVADHIIYQSEFVKNWWEEQAWQKNKPFNVIKNAVDLNEFYPNSVNSLTRVICLEGTLDYSPYAINLINKLNDRLKKYSIPFEVYGQIKFTSEMEKLSKDVRYLGIVTRESLPEIYQNSIYLSLDINAACPNTVIESLACGSPVVGYDTGALKELVDEKSGEIVFYNNNKWKIIEPDLDNLERAILKVVGNYKEYSLSARKNAEDNFDMNIMIADYLKVFNDFRSDKMIYKK